MTQQQSRRLFWSALLGNLFEHYDIALFGFLSPFLAHLVFPKQDPVAALILTYAMIPLGMVVRPLGSLIFGYIGDVYGRKTALSISMGGMALVSGAIAFSPTNSEAGLVSPILFAIGRIIQNFLAAGESMGGAIFLLEQTEAKKQDFLSSLYSASTIAGILFASLGVAFLCYLEIIDTGWRLLYLFGCITALFGWFLRKTNFQESQTEFSIPPKKNLAEELKALWTYKVALIQIALVAGFGYACYSVSLVLLNGFIPLISSITKAEMTGLNTILLLFDFCALPFFGWLSAKITREKMMLSASLCIVLLTLPLLLLLNSPTFSLVVLIRVCFVLFGVAFFAPFHAWVQQLVPASHRYFIISFGYALGVQLLGAPTAAISLWMYKKTGIIVSIGWYWIALAFSCAILFLNNKQKISTNEAKHEQLRQSIK